MKSVVPNLVDENRFVPSDSCNDRFVFFMLGHISKQKGIDDLLHAIALWKPDPKTVEFCIGGEGRARQGYMQLARELGVEACIKWLGSVNRKDAPRLFQQCDCFVLSSLHETFGVVLAEAIACGKPVIATRCGGPESIVNEANGRLVEVGQPPALSLAMQEMLMNREHYDADAIREDFLARFSRGAVTKQIVEVYRSVLN